jgi:hypothetical protein
MGYGVLVQFLARVRRPEWLASKISEIRATLGMVRRECISREEKAKNSRDKKGNWFHFPALVNFSKIFWLTYVLENCTDFLLPIIRSRSSRPSSRTGSAIAPKPVPAAQRLPEEQSLRRLASPRAFGRDRFLSIA